MPKGGHLNGLDLGRFFFQEIVEPIIEDEFPALKYAAGLIGSGSEVLGFDDEMSTDHHWGPRIMLFLSVNEHKNYHSSIQKLMAERLPYNFRGYSTNFSPPNPEDGGTQLLHEINEGPINHRVEDFSLKGYCQYYLGIDPDQALTAADWLTIPGQKLRAFTAGDVFRDDNGDLSKLRETLSYYPRDVWLYMLAAGWARIGQEEHFLGRTGYRGDEIGSSLIAARLVHDLMNLCFLIEKIYPPFSKWFGTAFKELDCANYLSPIFLRVLKAGDWKEREEAIIPAYEYIAARFNELGIIEPISTEVSQFFGRPFMIIGGDKPAILLKAQIKNPEVKKIAEATWIGGVEQLSNSTDFLMDVSILTAIREIFRKPD